MPVPRVILDIAQQASAKFGLRLSRRRPMRDPTELLCLKSKELGVETVLDVGANTGQFALDLRRVGWLGRIVSFEPLAAAHGKLTEGARSDPLWVVPPAMALGSTATKTEINVAANSVSSSLLAMESRSTAVEPNTKYTSVEMIDVGTLDDSIAPEWGGPFALKLDTQGFELEVLRGAEKTLPNVRVIATEMSLVSLYKDGARFADVFRFLEDRGFTAIAITEGFADAERNEVLQVDVVFVRKPD